MNINRRNIAICLLVLGAMVSACGPAEIVPYVPLSAGGIHTCALTLGGGVKCWGDNEYGQLGNGTTIDRRTPADVVGLTDRVTALAAGGIHTCALTLNGGVKCWGDNVFGQLGDGTTTNRHTPVDVVGLTGRVVAIAAGWNYTCALTVGSGGMPPAGGMTPSGGVKCWGGTKLGDFGDFGDGTFISRLTPVDVVGLTDSVTAIAAGGDHACVLTLSGGVKCWGNNGIGELGDGTTQWHKGPVNVIGLESRVSAITAGGFHTCALTASGGVKCWGVNDDGQLGDGTQTARTAPVDVTGLTSGVVAISAGDLYTCALTASGGVKCWGDNDQGQLGDGTNLESSKPVDVIGLTSGVIGISTDSDHTCAVMSNGGIKCWGSNQNGQLGDGTTTQRLTPVDVLP